MRNNRLSERLTINRLQDKPTQTAADKKVQIQSKDEARPKKPVRTRSDTGSSASIEEEIERQASIEENRDDDEDKKYHLLTKIVNILLVIGCVYIIFLIYGVSVTDYYYNSDGQIEAQRLSVSEIKEQKNYEHVLSQYQLCRALYEETLLLDYRLGAGEEDPMVIAPEYEALLTDVEDLSIKTDAVKVDSRYEQIKEMILSWIQDDIAVYLQNMSAAISENDSETANNALQDRDRVYQNFSLITQNMVAMGEQTPGIDLTDLKQWTPESYVDEQINGAQEE